MPFADINGQRLFFEDTGGDASNVIVFSHGLLMDHEMWAPQIDFLRNTWRCISWDARAHGQTVTTPDDFSYWDSAADLWSLLDHLGVDHAVLAGMSQGGFLSLRAALTAPERVRALVLIDTQPGTEDPDKVAAYDGLIDAWGGAAEVSQELLDIVAAIILGVGWDDTAVWQSKWRAITPDQLRQAYKTLVTRQDDVTTRLAELTMPAIVIHGTDDAAISVRIGQEFAETIGAEFHAIEGAGHASNLTHPEPVNRVLVPFLQQLS